MTVDSPPPAHRGNPVFWLIWLLPAAAVIGGIATLVIALRSADRQLPASYHWEGERLDRDFARQRLAAAHGIEMDVAWSADGRCSARLRSAPGDPAALKLLFTSSANADLDRVVLLQRLKAGVYEGACAPLPPGRWRVALEDAAGDWAIRAVLVGGVPRLELRARDPDGARGGA